MRVVIVLSTFFVVYLLILLLFTFWMRVSNFERRFAVKRTRRRCGRPFYIYTVRSRTCVWRGFQKMMRETHRVKIWKIHSISCVSCCFVCAFVGPKRFPVSQEEVKKKISSNSLKVCSGSMGDERREEVAYNQKFAGSFWVSVESFSRRERKLGYRRSLRRENKVE